MSKQDARNYRRCFRMTRSVYWSIHEEARNLHMTPSAYIYWAMAAVTFDHESSTTDDVIEWFRQYLPMQLIPAFERAVEKTADDVTNDDVPW